MCFITSRKKSEKYWEPCRISKMDLEKIISRLWQFITEHWIEIANIFNNFFTSIAAKTKESIKYYHKHFSNFLKNKSDDFFFLSPTDKHEIINYISSFDSSKWPGPNSIPTIILKLLRNDIFTQLSDVFNVSFLTDVFPSILKIAKVVHIHKK